MGTKTFTLLKSCSVSLILTFTVFAHSQQNDNLPFDRDLYEVGRSLVERADRHPGIPTYTRYPTPGYPEVPVRVRPYEDHPAAEYYRRNMARFTSPQLSMVAEHLGKINAKAFMVPGTHRVTLRDMLFLTFINSTLPEKDKYSQLPQVDITGNNTYFLEKELQRMADTLYSQMQAISREFAKVVYTSLVLSDAPNRQQYEVPDFIKFVLNDTPSSVRSEFSNIEPSIWSGKDPLSQKVMESFMNTYPRALQIQKGDAGFLHRLSIVFDRVPESRKNALIENFAALADSLVGEKNNLAANMVGRSIQRDFRVYGWSTYYTGHKLRSACGKVF